MDSFKRAFPSVGTAHLLIKSINGDSYPEKLAALRESSEGRGDIDIKDGYLELPTGPGWGTEIDEAAVRAHPPKPAGDRAGR